MLYVFIGHGRVYISESLTPSRKKLFGEINKIKKSRSGNLYGRKMVEFSFGKLKIPGSMASIQRRISLNSVDVDANQSFRSS